MKGNTFKTLNKKTFSMLTAIFMLVQIFLPIVSTVNAATRPDSVRVVTDASEKQALLDANNEELSLLGIANNFSIFSDTTVTLNSSDVEGRVAARKGVVASTNYKYQIGWKYENDDAAKIIVEDGPVTNVALDFGADDEGNTFADKKIVAASSKNTNWDYDPDELANNVVSADLIDFDDEYNKLKAKSLEINNYTTNTTSEFAYGNVSNWVVFNDRVSGSPTDFWYGATVFHGTDGNLNVFSITTSDWNNCNGAIVFDVPVESSVIINVKDGNQINLNEKNGFFYLTNKEQIAKANAKKEDLAYVVNDEGNLLMDENNEPKIFHRVTPGQLSSASSENVILENEFSKEYAERLLWNIPYSTQVNITRGHNNACFMGTILAPNATCTITNSGYIQGNIICKTMVSSAQIGYVPLKIKGKVNVNINKTDKENVNSISGAKMALYKYNTDSFGNLSFSKKISEWTSDDSSHNVYLDAGAYILKEISSPESYENVNENYTVFEIKKEAYYNDENKLDYRTVPVIGYTEEKNKTELTRNSISITGGFPTSWSQLYSAYPETRQLLESGKLITEIAFDITEVDSSIENSDLYVIVADNNGEGVRWYCMV